MDKCIWLKLGICKKSGCKFSACVPERKEEARIEFWFLKELSEWEGKELLSIDKVYLGWRGAKGVKKEMGGRESVRQQT